MESVLHKLKLSILVFILSSVVPIAEAQGTFCYVSNLDNRWTQGGIGDIHNLFRGGIPYGNDTARFVTGAGSSSVNAITLEFYFESGYPAGSAAPQWLSIQLFQGDSLLGSFGNPALDPRQTQWPQSLNPIAYTQFIDFSPLQPITLNPFTEYSIIAGMPAESPVAAALLFTKSPAYTTASDWTMGATTTGNPFASGEFLVLEVQASAVPEPSFPALCAAGAALLFWGRRSPSGHNQPHALDGGTPRQGENQRRLPAASDAERWPLVP